MVHCEGVGVADVQGNVAGNGIAEQAQGGCDIICDLNVCEPLQPLFGFMGGKLVAVHGGFLAGLTHASLQQHVLRIKAEPIRGTRCGAQTLCVVRIYQLFVALLHNHRGLREFHIQNASGTSDGEHAELGSVGVLKQKYALAGYGQSDFAQLFLLVATSAAAKCQRSRVLLCGVGEGHLGLVENSGAGFRI